jgi:type IV pilus assembly protein PilW
MTMLPEFKHTRHHGFSLVEIMVGMVIGLLSTLAVMQVFASWEGQKRTTSAGSDAQSNGAIALYNVERDLRMAGYGMGVSDALNCTVNQSYNGTASALSLVPVKIDQGAGNLPDTITILYSSKDSFSLPARVTVDHPPQATNFFINSTVGLAVGDLLVAWESGKDCTLIEITGIPSGNIQIHHQSTSPWNPPGGQNIFPAGGYKIGTKLFNFGNLPVRIYSVNSTSPNGGLQLNTTIHAATGLASSTDILASDIINLQAEYGMDDGTGGTANDGIVDTWTTAAPANLKQLLAVRLAIAARSTVREKTAVTPNNGSWSGGTIDLSINADGTANADWQFYRYKIFDTIVPLRNMIWNAS